MENKNPREAAKEVLLKTPDAGCEELLSLHVFRKLAAEEGEKELEKDLEYLFRSLKSKVIGKGEGHGDGKETSEL